MFLTDFFSITYLRKYVNGKLIIVPFFLFLLLDDLFILISFRLPFAPFVIIIHVLVGLGYENLCSAQTLVKSNHCLSV